MLRPGFVGLFSKISPCYCIFFLFHHIVYFMVFDNHDSAYKLLFSHSEMVVSLLQDFVREDWVSSLDFSTLEPYASHYVSDDMQWRQNDMVWRVKSRELDTWFYVYVLFEFQSQVDARMALRILVYVGLLYQELIQKGQIKANELLPPVFPLVLYNGLGRWTAARELSELIMPLSVGLRDYFHGNGIFCWMKVVCLRIC